MQQSGTEHFEFREYACIDFLIPAKYTKGRELRAIIEYFPKEHDPGVIQCIAWVQYTKGHRALVSVFAVTTASSTSQLKRQIIKSCIEDEIFQVALLSVLDATS